MIYFQVRIDMEATQYYERVLSILLMNRFIQQCSHTTGAIVLKDLDPKNFPTGVIGSF